MWPQKLKVPIAGLDDGNTSSCCVNAGTILNVKSYLTSFQRGGVASSGRRLHRSAVIGLPSDPLVDSTAVAALINQLAEYETTIDSGLRIVASAWKMASGCGGHDGMLQPSGRDKSPSHRTDPFVTPSLLLNPWYGDGWDVCERTICDGPSTSHRWSICALSCSKLALHPTTVTLSVEYSVADWSFESAWALPAAGGPSMGWLRHWERCCHRVGALLMTVSQIPPDE
jgi:hypothetical protein